MKVTNKITNLTLALFVSVGIITACSPMPNTVQNGTSSQVNNSQSGQNSDTSASLNTSTTVDQNTELNDVKVSYQDDEQTAKDSELIANSEAGFQTKAVKLGVIAGIGTGNNKASVIAKGKVSKEERKTIIDAREKLVNARIKLVDVKLKLLKEVKKDLTDKVSRKDVYIRTSDVAEISNDDGTTTKIITIRFENKADSTIYRENKLSKTYSADNKLISIEHIITAYMKNHTRNYSKFADINADGSRNVVINSIIKWDNGRMRVVNESRDINADGSGTGTATITVTSADGQTKTYTVTTTINVSGEVIITPDPNSTLSPSPTPQSTPTPTSSPTPQSSPTPSASSTPQQSPSSTPLPSI